MLPLLGPGARCRRLVGGGASRFSIGLVCVQAFAWALGAVEAGVAVPPAKPQFRGSPTLTGKARGRAVASVTPELLGVIAPPVARLDLAPAPAVKGGSAQPLM